MAFFLHHLANGKELPKCYKAAYLIKLWPGTIYLGTTVPEGHRFRFSVRLPISIFKEIAPPADFFQHINPAYHKSDLVCIAEDADWDAACWIDIPRQLDICSMPSGRLRHWLVVPEAYKMIKDEYDDDKNTFKFDNYEPRKKQTTKGGFYRCIQKIYGRLRRRSSWVV